jgi:hypothetical protein
MFERVVGWALTVHIFTNRAAMRHFSPRSQAQTQPSIGHGSMTGPDSLVPGSCGLVSAQSRYSHSHHIAVETSLHRAARGLGLGMLCHCFYSRWIPPPSPIFCLSSDKADLVTRYRSTSTYLGLFQILQLRRVRWPITSAEARE